MSEGPIGTSVEPPLSMRRQAVRGVVWTTLDKWSVRLSTLVAFIVLGNLLGPADFGVVALAMTMITVLTTLADAGFSQYLLQHRRLGVEATSSAFYTSAGLSVLLAGGLALSAGPISEALQVPELRPVLPALAASLVVGGLSSVPAMLLRRELRFKELAVRSVLATVVSVVVAIALALAGAGVWALVAQTLVRSVVALVVLWVATDFRPRLVYDRAEMRAMTSYGSKSLAVQLGAQLNGQGQTFLIGILAGPVALGYWVVASRLVGVVIDVCTSVVGAVANPVFARLQDQPERLSRALGTAMGLAAFVTVPALVCLSLVSEEVVPAVFGSQWVPAAVLASVLTLRGILRALSSFGGSVLMATGHPSAELLVTTTLVVVQLSLVALFHEDLVVLAVAVTLGTGLTMPIRTLLVRRLLGVRAGTYARTASVLFAAGLAAGAVLGVQELAQLEGLRYVLLAVGLGAVVYLGSALVVCRPVIADLADAASPVLARLRRRRTAGAPAS